MGSCLSAPSPERAKKAPPLKKLQRSDTKTELMLHRIPGRIFLNGSVDVASLFTKQGKKGINQDAMIVWEDFSLRPGTIFCGVFDGHGPKGHFVAKKVRDSLPLKLKAQYELIAQANENVGISDLGNSDHETSSFLRGEEQQTQHCLDKDDVFPILRESLVNAFKVVDKELKLHPYIDSYNSGTTAVALVKQGQHLVIGNVGDSRAVLGSRDKDGSLLATQLTVDLKPNLPKEARRIRSCKGRVFALRNEPEIHRLWLPNHDSPGLAMSRAFGDFCLKGFGLISVPDITYYEISGKDEFVVLATDGVWDVLTNEEVMEIVASSPRASAAQTLVETAVRTWRTKYPYAKVDDCAAVCLFLGEEDKTMQLI
ncbi:probable protein phosphatase 2C 33 [Rutidosis leptorrhynchoides]|uniref:probable protein phosphatase 2C 33 n=1 Tax=Rutidosis leptorrhynchoides TaxID=125765 RepID=UPI003A99ECE2